MRIGVLSDIHSNRIALEAVLDDLEKRDVDALVHAGDVVGYNPWPAACLEALRERSVPTVMGNHDRAVASGTAFRFNDMARAGVEHACEQLSDEQLEWLADRPDERLEFEGRVHIVHGHPDDPDRYTYPQEFSSEMVRGEADVLVMGHTHVQGHAIFEDGGGGEQKIAMNPGGVGQPRDGDPRAAYAVVDLDAMTVEEFRVEYDVDRVIEAVREAGLPERIGLRLRKGR
jgi:putative phosphoesterase